MRVARLADSGFEFVCSLTSSNEFRGTAPKGRIAFYSSLALSAKHRHVNCSRDDYPRHILEGKLFAQHSVKMFEKLTDIAHDAKYLKWCSVALGIDGIP